jgi:hypothetical protein
MRLVLIALMMALLVPNFINRDLNNTAYYTPPYDGNEKYETGLGYINSTDKLQQYIDEEAAACGAEPGSVAYITLVEDVIERRFYHGFSHLSTNENWIAAVSEKIFGFGLSCKVSPNDIMEHGNAACSQQCMVMMEVLKAKNIPYRKVGFPHHYALEAQVNGQWYYFDPNMEPTMTAAERHESAWTHQADNLKKYYDTDRFKDLDYKFGNNEAVLIGNVNETPAGNLKMFHLATMLLSKTAFLLPLLVLVLSRARSYGRLSNSSSLAALRLYIQHLLRRTRLAYN